MEIHVLKMEKNWLKNGKKLEKNIRKNQFLLKNKMKKYIKWKKAKENGNDNEKNQFNILNKTIRCA